jgi:hypothetical protein
MEFAGPASIGVTSAEAAIRDGRIGYLALGDRHSTTDVGSTGRIWYAGAPEPTDYDEIASGNVLVVTLAPAGRPTVEVVRTGSWRFERPRFELDGGLGELRAWLDALPEKARTIVKLTLVGTIPLAVRTELDELLEHAGDLLGGLERWERHTELVVRPDDDDFADLALGGFAAVAHSRSSSASWPAPRAGRGPGEAPPDPARPLPRRRGADDRVRPGRRHDRGRPQRDRQVVHPGGDRPAHRLPRR